MLQHGVFLKDLWVLSLTCSGGRDRFSLTFSMAEVGMAINKVFPSFQEAIADIQDGATIMFGGFTARGSPAHLILALRDKGVKDITVITNDTCGGWRDDIDCSLLVETRQVKKVIASFPVAGQPSRVCEFERQYLAGEIELELVPQGTLAERIRAAGAGLGAFYTPTGVGTPFAEGKETRVINGRECILELPLGADFALVHAHKADTMGNLIYRGMSRNFNPIMATAARVTIAEAEEVVPAGELSPEAVVTPGVYVNRIVEIPKGGAGR
jgi:3-oxoacid CoA-transferase A subunit